MRCDEAEETTHLKSRGALPTMAIAAMQMAIEEFVEVLPGCLSREDPHGHVEGRPLRHGLCVRGDGPG